MAKIYDLIIIGAGPAGITAAVYAARQKVDTLILTDNIGGQASYSATIENYTGFQFISGAELAEIFEKHVRKYPIDIKTFDRVKKITKLSENNFSVVSDSGEYFSKTLILASGKTPRQLKVPGEEALRGMGVSYCAVCDGPLFTKKSVAVIGGGNSALDAAIRLANIAAKVYLVNLNASLNGDQVMIDGLSKAKNVEILNNTRVSKINGDKFVEGLTVVQNGLEKNLAVEGIFVEIGMVPNSDFGLELRKDAQGQVIVDSQNNTNIYGVFAAGDVTNVPEKQIIIAAGEGAKAALNAIKCLIKLACSKKEVTPMAKWKCLVCGYVYDPAQNNNVAFENLPADWTCPECGAGKDQFERIN